MVAVFLVFFKGYILCGIALLIDSYLYDNEDEVTGCKGFWSGHDPRDFDCGYPYAGDINCDQCMFGAFDGKKDPRKPH